MASSPTSTLGDDYSEQDKSPNKTINIKLKFLTISINNELAAATPVIMKGAIAYKNI